MAAVRAAWVSSVFSFLLANPLVFALPLTLDPEVRWNGTTPA